MTKATDYRSCCLTKVITSPQCVCIVQQALGMSPCESLHVPVAALANMPVAKTHCVTASCAQLTDAHAVMFSNNIWLGISAVPCASELPAQMKVNHDCRVTRVNRESHSKCETVEDIARLEATSSTEGQAGNTPSTPSQLSQSHAVPLPSHAHCPPADLLGPVSPTDHTLPGS